MKLFNTKATLLLTITTTLGVNTSSAWQLPSSAPRASSSSLRMMAEGGGKAKVTVLGGTGFVGSRVCKLLQEEGADVTSVSKSGTIPSWCAGEAWTDGVSWKSADLLGGDESSLVSAIGTPESIVSCVGVVGFDREELLKGNGNANVAGFNAAAKSGGLKRSVFVSVSSEVAACEEKWLPEFFGGYFEGKRMAEKAALEAVEGNADSVCIVKPTFIYGGGSFGLFPPRVNAAYGSAVEELLSNKLIRVLADVTPGLIKVALRPPSAVEAVAGACAKAALGEKVKGTLDGTDDINEAAGQPDPTGLTEAIEWTGEKAKDVYGWLKVEVPKLIDSVKEKSA
mmetsp:Transcript_3075/g.4676  ORF Transcript_3075/g.4676 Transcript_3075/m.4676 type:complete len:339 (-) Transcript_3075:460-1476(-)